MRRFFAIFLSIWTATCNIAHAAPAITAVTASGALVSGVALTVAGSGFGTKPVGAPLKFDTFESGTVGNNIGNGWATTIGANGTGTGFVSSLPKYTNAVLRTNSTRSIKHSFEDQGFTCPDFEGCQWSCSYGVTGDAGITNNISGLKLPVVYLDFWYYYAPDSPESRNVKICRIHNNTTGSDPGLDRPNLYVNIYCYANSDGMRVGQDGGGLTGKVYDNRDQSCAIPGNCIEDWHGSSWWQGQWRHVQLYLKESSIGGSDGTIKLWTDGVLDPNATNWINRTVSGDWDTAWIGNFMSKGSDAACPTNSYTRNHYSYSDDAYIDTTLAHVEIGDNANYNLCTEREIQVVSAWSAGSITVPAANAGAFPNLTGKYLFVVDRNGAIASFPLSPGPIGGATCPSPGF